MDTLERMLELQHELQTETYGHNFQRMTPEQRIHYIKDTKLALSAELQEALDEVGWKPWATSRRINRDAYVGELVDALHFFMNMLLVLGDDPRAIAAELFTRYCIKNRINAERQVNGYDGVSTKCVECGRALDDPAVSCWRRGDQAWCSVTNVNVNILEQLCPRCGKPINLAATSSCDPEPRVVGTQTDDRTAEVHQIYGSWCAQHGTYDLNSIKEADNQGVPSGATD